MGLQKDLAESFYTSDEWTEWIATLLMMRSEARRMVMHRRSVGKVYRFDILAKASEIRQDWFEVRSLVSRKKYSLIYH
jgi:hypothetical protein